MAAPELERKLLAILAADVVAYSSMMEADEAGTIMRLRAVRAEITDPAIGRHNGRTVKLMGDGALAAFASVVDAVACAAEIQEAMAGRNQALPNDQRMVLRIGVNLGDVVLLEDDIYGDGVNVAARLQQLCAPGGMAISGTAYDHLQGKLAVPLDFAGEQQVKNINRPVRVYTLRMGGVAPAGHPLPSKPSKRAVGWSAAAAALTLALTAAFWLWPQDNAIGKPSLAVLPFDNFGGDAATGRLADGLTEDIITDLATYREFDVIARNSVEVYKGKPADIKQVGKDLDVRYVLEGSIQHDLGRVRITAQLIDVASANHLWSQRWDRVDGDFFAIQSEIAREVTNALGGGSQLIARAERNAARRKAPGNLNAYEAYLLGGEKLEDPTPANLEQAIRLLNQAIKLDPQLARAWATLFHAYDIAAFSGIDAEASRKNGAEAAQNAVNIDPADASAHVALGSSYGNAGDLMRAKAEFEAALRLAPGSAYVLTMYSGWAASFGDPIRGGEMADRVVRLNPICAPSTAARLSYAYFAADRYEDALRILERTTPENYTPDIWIVHAGALAALDRLGEARNWAAEALKRYPDMTVEGWANQPGYADEERQRFIKTMALAGFPKCASAEVLAATATPLRVPECEAQASQ